MVRVSYRLNGLPAITNSEVRDRRGPATASCLPPQRLVMTGLLCPQCSVLLHALSVTFLPHGNRRALRAAAPFCVYNSGVVLV